MSTRQRKKLIEANWMSYRAILPATASASQIIETRRAFYAGAQALFFSIMTILEPGKEATDGDLAAMDDVVQELRVFAQLVDDGVA